MGLDTNRVLRIGVVYRGHVVAERVLDRRIDVSIGTRSDCTVQVNGTDYPDFPAQVAVAVVQAGAYHIVVPPDPAHAITLRGGPAGAADGGKQQSVLVRGVKCLPAEPFNGGSLALGDVIVMFQFVRGDSVPTITRERTVLRVGLVHDARLLSDQVFELGHPVSIGPGKRDTLVLPDVDYKGQAAVFYGAKNANNFDVKLPKDCLLKVAINGVPMDLAELVSKKHVSQQGDTLHLKLPIKSRGRASLGPYTLLFQVIRQSVTVPAMPRKTLAGQIFGSLWADSAWTVSLAISFLLFGSIVAQAQIYYETHTKFMQRAQEEEERQQSIYDVQVEEKEEPKPEEKKPEVDILSDKAKAEQEKEKDEKKPEKPKEVKPQSAGKQLNPDEIKAQARQRVERDTVAGAFKTKFFQEAGEGEAGDVVARTFSGSGEGADDAAGVGSGVKLAAGSGAGGGTVEKVNAGKSGGFGDRDQDAAKTEIKKKEEIVQVILKTGGMDGDGEGKTEIARVIQRKNSAVQRCYEQALRENPDISGKVKVTFTVGMAGTITDVSVSGAQGSFEDCIKSKFTSIRGLPNLPSPQTFSQSYIFQKGS